MKSLDEYKQYLPDYLNKYHNITNLKKFFHCLNPEHTDNNPSMMFTSKYNICKCFACGVSYDIFDLIGIDFNITNFKDKIRKVEEIYEGYTPMYDECEPQNFQSIDYTSYYNKCEKRINKTSYLENRGIEESLIHKYHIGYDEKRNLIVFPITQHCYFARSIVNNIKIKSKGTSDIWNKDILNHNGLVYVTEGIIDSLSLETIDPNVQTLSLNGVGNIHALVHAIKEKNFNGEIIIAFDNDIAGIKASKILQKELEKINVISFSNTLIANFDDTECKDINQALITNKELLEENYRYFDTAYRKIIEQKKHQQELIL